MKKIIRFAARNVAVNKRRTLITIITIAVGLCAINVGKGIMSGMQRESELSVTEGRTGEIQIHKKGYFESSELSILNYSIEKYSHLENELQKTSGIEFLAGRIQFGGIMARGDETAVVVFCRAADIENEVKVCSRVKESIVEGRFLTKDDINGAVIAGGLKRGIGAKIGERVIIVANTKDGYQNAIELEVIGIIEEKVAQANARLVYIPIHKAQELLFMEDEVTEVVIKTSMDTNPDILNGRLNHMLKERGLESNTWKDVSAFFVDIMKKQNAVVFVICLVFYLIVVSSITNTMLLTLFERKKEIGTMMAIGIKGAHVTRLIVLESTILGFIGSMFGILMSISIILFLSGLGVTYKPPSSSQYVTIYPLINIPFMLLSFMLGLISAVAASIYPARKVLQVNPVDALRAI